VINAVLPVAYFAGDLAMYAWLSLEALRIWSEHGPSRTLVGSAGIAAFAAVAVHGDHAAGYHAIRRVLALGEARGYEPDASQARFLFAALSCWFEPIDDGVHAAQRAREGLIAGDDLANAGWTYYTTTMYLQDCAPSLEDVVAAEDAGLAFARRTGSALTGQLLEPYRWLAGVLRRESSAARSPPPNVTPAIRWRCLSRISPAGSPVRSLAISPVSCATSQRRCLCCRPLPAPT
jgi:hypothetical protein